MKILGPIPALFLITIAITHPQPRPSEFRYTTPAHATITTNGGGAP